MDLFTRYFYLLFKPHGFKSYFHFNTFQIFTPDSFVGCSNYSEVINLKLHLAFTTSGLIPFALLKSFASPALPAPPVETY